MSPEEEKAAIYKSINYLERQVSQLERRILRPEDIAKATVDELIDRISDQETVEVVVAVWGKALDQHIGKGIRKLFWLVLIIALSLAATKLGAWAALFK